MSVLKACKLRTVLYTLFVVSLSFFVLIAVMYIYCFYLTLHCYNLIWYMFIILIYSQLGNVCQCVYTCIVYNIGTTLMQVVKSDKIKVIMPY